MADPDAIVIGAGPNGLSAAIVLAQAGRRVTVFEALEQIGGGASSAELTLPGFTHDICSAIHPMAVASPIFRSLGLEAEGLEWIRPVPLAHPLDDGHAVLLEESLEATARALHGDARAYTKLLEPLVDRSDSLLPALLEPLLPPRHPITLARFGMNAIRS